MKINRVKQGRRQFQIRSYIFVADTACEPVADQDSNRPATYDYQADLRIGGLRAQMLLDWESVPYGQLRTDQIPTVRKIISEFQAANDYWAAMTSATAANNNGARDTALGQFTAAEGAFEADATQFGFGCCDHAWPNLEPS